MTMRSSTPMTITAPRPPRDEYPDRDDHPMVARRCCRRGERGVRRPSIPHRISDRRGIEKSARRPARRELVRLDLGLPACECIDALRRFPPARIRSRVGGVLRGRRSGLHGPPPCTPERRAFYEDVDAPLIRRAAAPRRRRGNLPFRPRRWAKSAASSRRPRPSATYRRQLDVLRLIVKGYSATADRPRLKIAETPSSSTRAPPTALLGVSSAHAGPE